MENSERDSSILSIDINNNDFDADVQREIESDLSRNKKEVEVINNLRITAVEMEVETAALYHACLYKQCEELEAISRDVAEEITKNNSPESKVKEHSQDEILTFEYGQHEPGEQVSFIYNGVIPAFKPRYLLNVTTDREGLQKNFTYLRVEYLNALSSIVVFYDPDKRILTFHVKFPFVETSMGILGYALPK